MKNLVDYVAFCAQTVIDGRPATQVAMVEAMEWSVNEIQCLNERLAEVDSIIEFFGTAAGTAAQLRDPELRRRIERYKSVCTVQSIEAGKRERGEY